MPTPVRREPARFSRCCWRAYADNYNGTWRWQLTSLYCCRDYFYPNDLALVRAQRLITRHEKFTAIGGIVVGSNDDIIKYALNGDLNFDGRVNNADLNILKQHYAPTTGAQNTTWTDGNINYSADGLVTTPDVDRLKDNFMVDIADGPLAANYVRTLTATGLTIHPGR